MPNSVMQHEFETGRLTQQEVHHRIMSWWGHAQHADAWTIARQLLSEYTFHKPRKPKDGQ